MFWKRRRKEQPAPLHTPEEPEFWRRLAVGSSVELRDFQALEEAHAGGTAGGGLNYEVTSRRHYTFRGAGDGVVAEYLLFDIADAETSHVLAAVVTGPTWSCGCTTGPTGSSPAPAPR